MSSYTDRDIHCEIAGRELEILQALGIHLQGRGHQHCPFPDHEDRRPSWRWDAGKARWFCSCGGGSIIDAVMRAEGLAAGEAIRWIRSTVLGDDEAPEPRRRPAPPPANSNAEQQRRRLQEEVADRALRLWQEAAPASPNHPYLRAKDVGAHELRERNGVLYVPLFDIDGRVWTLQTISQGADDGFGKRFMRGGRVAGLFAPIGLNAPPRRLIICEGWATGATLHEQTGWPVMAAMNAGNLMAVAKTARKTWEAADIVLAADNDRRTRGNPGASKATEAALVVGARLAVPQFPENAGDKDSDFNDLHRIDPGAVAAAIEAAERPAPPPAEGVAVATLTAAEASERTRQAIARFFERALAYVPDLPDPLDINAPEPPPPFAMGIRGSVGLGKTQLTLEHLVRPELADKFINYYGPTHALNGELLERFAAMAGPDSPKARVVYGREQVRPDGEPMCAKSDLAKSVALLGQNVQRHLCEKERETGEIEPETGKPRVELERCEHFSGCPYQRQRGDRSPGVRFLSHAHLHLEGAVPHADLAIVDESHWQGALRGTDVRLYPSPEGIVATGGYAIFLGSLQLPRSGINDATNADLVAISQRCAKAIYAGGALKNFRDAGVTATDAKWAKGVEYSRIERLDVRPGMPRARQEEGIKRYRQQEALRFARFFGLLAECLDAGVDPCRDCFELVRDVKNPAGGLDDKLYMYWADKVRAPAAPALLLDANLETRIAKRFFPGLEPPVIAEARLQSYHGTQITDHSVPKARIAPPYNPESDPQETKRRANRRGELRRLVEVEAARGKTLCVSYRDVHLAMEAEGEISNARFAHWNRLRGHDEWRDADTLIVAGLPQPSVEAIERMARAMWRLDPTPIQTIPPDRHGAKRYKRELRLITLADGGTRPIAVDVHPDPRCTLLLDQVRGEVMQAVGRMRLVHRSADRPCKLIVLTNYPLPIPVHELSTWDGVMPDPLAVLVARGIVPQAWRDIEAALPDMIEPDRGKPGDAARDAFRRAGIAEFSLLEILYTENSAFRLFRYRVEGRRKSSRVLVDLNRHPDPKAAVERTLGELTLFEAATPNSGGEVIETTAPPPAPVAVPDRAPPDVVAAAGEIADTGKISDTVAAEPSQPGSEIMPEPEPAPASAAEVEPFSEADDWPGPDPAEMRPQAALPRLVISNPSSESPEGPEKLSDTELIRLLPPKQPTDTAVGWECRCQDVLGAWKIEWFRAQKLVREESAAHNWQAHSPVLLVSTRDSP